MTDDEKARLKDLVTYTAPEFLLSKLMIFVEGVIARERNRAAEIVEEAVEKVLDYSGE